MKSKPTTIDEYLASLNADQRDALERIRRAVQAAAPTARECISYGLPAFELGKKLVAFGAAAKHCAFYPMSGSVISQLTDELTRFETSKGTIRFQPDKPLPLALIRKIVKLRMAEMDS